MTLSQWIPVLPAFAAISAAAITSTFALKSAATTARMSLRSSYTTPRIAAVTGFLNAVEACHKALTPDSLDSVRAAALHVRILSFDGTIPTGLARHQARCLTEALATAVQTQPALARTEAEQVLERLIREMDLSEAMAEEYGSHHSPPLSDRDERALDSTRNLRLALDIVLDIHAQQDAAPGKDLSDIDRYLQDLSWLEQETGIPVKQAIEPGPVRVLRHAERDRHKAAVAGVRVSTEAFAETAARSLKAPDGRR
ncbi:hypothetical protein [Streptomyces virginiae]|uniref:hypothetical protein n=1 Tax=Streptomyces virginiae TaxID=1961 RepID=UPI003703385B